jgi:predicted nucleic acid-binding protein
MGDTVRSSYDDPRQHASASGPPCYTGVTVGASLYGTVVIPRAVRDELLRPSAREMVRGWIGQLPAWLEVHTPANAPDALLVNLDPGERDAILLAGELRADQLIVDDRQGRHEAENRGIPVMGTLVEGGQNVRLQCDEGI